MESHLRKEVGQTVIDFQREVARRRQASGDCVPMTNDERDRLTRLETQFSHLSKSVDDTHVKVTIMHDLLMQAKGMRLLIVAMAAVAGFFSALVAKYFPFLR
jgi:hypothetical protein